MREITCRHFVQRGGEIMKNNVRDRDSMNINHLMEVKSMKKNLFIVAIAVLALAFASGYAFAVAQGPCVNCHTMHDSQNGVGVTGAGPQPVLLNKVGCLGCHGQNTAANIINYIPQVVTQGTDLAAGNFAYLLNAGAKVLDAADSGATTSSAGHNVTDLGVAEANLTAPPGDENGTGITNANFTCSGTLGCHGDRTVSDKFGAVKGGHHGNDSILKFGAGFTLTGQGADVPRSYRFLKGVKGAEVSTWSNASAASHNDYMGSALGGVSEDGGIASPGSAGTISGLCAECHGNFHGASADVGGPTGTPWKRHPADIILPAGTTEYAAYAGANAWSVDAPVGRTAATLVDALAAPISSVTPGTDIVMCISCHKVHGSANADILRWNYSNINAGGGEVGAVKCFICHTTKDTGG
jgi:hypothetical protein